MQKQFSLLSGTLCNPLMAPVQSSFMRSSLISLDSCDTTHTPLIFLYLSRIWERDWWGSPTHHVQYNEPLLACANLSSLCFLLPPITCILFLGLHIAVYRSALEKSVHCYSQHLSCWMQNNRKMNRSIWEGCQALWMPIESQHQLHSAIG